VGGKGERKAQASSASGVGEWKVGGWPVAPQVSASVRLVALNAREPMNIMPLETNAK
jgi:hypothetical protein